MCTFCGYQADAPAFTYHDALTFQAVDQKSIDDGCGYDNAVIGEQPKYGAASIENGIISYVPMEFESLTECGMDQIKYSVNDALKVINVHNLCQVVSPNQEIATNQDVAKVID